MQWVLSKGRHLSKYFFWLIFIFVDFASWFAFHIFSFQIFVDLLRVYGGMRLCQQLLHELSLTIRSSPCLNFYSLKGYAQCFLMVNMSLLQAILHPVQNRVLTIRENARLQGFPDCYKLCGPVKERYLSFSYSWLKKILQIHVSTSESHEFVVPNWHFILLGIFSKQICCFTIEKLVFVNRRGPFREWIFVDFVSK